ncbi:carotenoid ester lipase precursor [Crepidotus variabilis]|uniref:Carboxylic ester hydrolase n=1 Tax=Crepidotus variabilis TaxID=179855 RepID=A0A9P6E4U1_9AGAR|nr:carotenoid ester lipase precursor [Crepidotus variabilis]
MFSALLLGLAQVALVLASNATLDIFDPKVTLDNGVFTGGRLLKTHRFLGIPFAQPPIGPLRFRLPQPIPAYSGSYNAKFYSLACPQQAMTVPTVPPMAQPAIDFAVNTILGVFVPDAEDCLTINVIKPDYANANSNLPVVLWIFGGGFEIGSPNQYDGTLIVTRSMTMGKPVIFVSMNYRISAFGFLSGKEVKSARVGNLGLQDQREAMRWVQKYISNFGGDPTKVTIFGESAGAISVSLHMLTNGGNTEGLFRAALMMSGGPIPVGDIASPGNQRLYDDLVKAAGCDKSHDSLSCLREVDYKTLRRAVDQSASFFSRRSLNLAWMPRADGYFLPENPQKLVMKGSIAKIPFITGNCDDEGTVFSLSTLDIHTDDEFKGWIRSYFFPDVPDSDVLQLMALYSSDITQGSPFGTGWLNAVSRQFKRIAAFQGDGVFQAPRRLLINYASQKNPNIWGYLSKRFKALPVAGSAHGSDIINMFSGAELAEALIRLATDLDPNAGRFGLQWPRYNRHSPDLYTLQDGIIPVTISPDTYRQAAMAFMTNVTMAYPV